ncbi:MAG: hypothetical protein ACLRSW_09715 [Christensenellaceae bacterium]
MKRDRWTWSGDVYQSALVNCHSHFDTEVVKRSLGRSRARTDKRAHNHITFTPSTGYSPVRLLSLYGG